MFSKAPHDYELSLQPKCCRLRLDHLGHSHPLPLFLPHHGHAIRALEDQTEYLFV
jgi:hypothetical protein